MRMLRVACFILLAATPLSAQAAEKVDKPVTVTGEAIVTATPGAGAIRIGVSSQGKTARAASDANAKEMGAVLAALKENGIDERDIQTGLLWLQPANNANSPHSKSVG